MPQARRWLPGRELAVVADSAFAALEFLAATSHRRVAVITRLRLDAALCDPAPPRLPGTVGRPRTTPCLLGLFSLVTLLGKQLTPQARQATATSSSYHKQRPTFANTLAAVRCDIWREQGFITSNKAATMKKLRPALRNAITYAPCHAA